MLKKKTSVAKRQRRKLSAEVQTKVALAALREDKTLAQLYAKFQVHSTQITEWNSFIKATHDTVKSAGSVAVPAMTCLKW